MSTDIFKRAFALKASEQEINRQLEQYNTLKPWQSFRGISALLIVSSIIITGVLTYFNFFAFYDVWIDVILLAILVPFVFRGSKVAIIITGIYWTMSKALLIIGNPSSFVTQIIFWWIFISYFYKAWQVERARSAKTKLDTQDSSFEPTI